MTVRSACLFVWDAGSKQWALRDIENTEAEAREKGRLLWRQGAAGIRIDVQKTVVEEIRPSSTGSGPE